ncbi:hypothetical protein D3C86_1723790 [compost metagenome]
MQALVAFEANSGIFAKLSQAAGQGVTPKACLIECGLRRVCEIRRNVIYQIKTAIQHTGRRKDEPVHARADRKCASPLNPMPRVLCGKLYIWKFEIIEIHCLRSVSLSRCQCQDALNCRTLFQ